MTPAPSAREARTKVWTAPRVALAALTFALLSAAFSPGCNPTDDTANTSAPAASQPATASSSPPSGRPARAPRPAPTPYTDAAPLPANLTGATLEDLAGAKFKLTDYQGKVVVLNVWATWCGPCRREIPEFVAMRKEFAAGEVEILGVTMEDERNTPEGVKEFVSEFGIDYRIAWADLDFYKTILSPGFQIPQTYVLGRDGRVVYKFVGYNSDVGNHVRAIVTSSLGG
jgi:thiol-disulfide isomerase/thioredoxin